MRTKFENASIPSSLDTVSGVLSFSQSYKITNVVFHRISVNNIETVSATENTVYGKCMTEHEKTFQEAC